MRFLLYILAIYIALTVAGVQMARGQATQPAANDRLIYLRADGTYIELQPADARWPIVNRDVSAATLTRADGSQGQWVAATQPATQPATKPVDTGSQPPLVVDPPPVDPPPTPKYVRIADKPRNERRGDGLNIVKSGLYADVLVRGYEQNITIAAGAPGPFVFENLRTTDAWRGTSAHINNGQGFYIGEKVGDVTIRGIYSARNGWHVGDKPGEKNDRRHGLYANIGGKLVIEDGVFDHNASAGIKLMRPTVLRQCFVHANALGIQSIAPLEIHDSVIFVGGYYVDQSGNVTGNTALHLYDNTKLRNVLIVAAPDTYDPRPEGKGPYDMGAVKLDSWHHQYGRQAGGKIDAENVVIVGWRGETFTGDRKPNGPVPGVTVLPNPVNVDVRPILADVDAGKITAAEGVKRATDAVRGAAK